MKRATVLVLVFGVGVLSLAAIVPGPGPAGVPVPDGYRTEAYRAPVPASVPGAARVDTDAVRNLQGQPGTVLVDVTPVPPPGAPARRHIDGSLWIPEAGEGRLDPGVEAALAARLRNATEGPRPRALIFYCLADCWYSWNAARRAIALGFSDVHWYAHGTDGWREAGLPLVEAEPPWPLIAERRGAFN